MNITQVKAKCRICKQEFIKPKGSLQIVCSVQCGIAHTHNIKDKKLKQEVKEKRKQDRIRREASQPKSYWIKKAQTEFNRYIRLRDAQEPCISCGRFHTGQYHAGHYRTTGAYPELRFEELNVHKQCSVCNNHRSGNLTEYRINLIKKIGLDKVEWIESHHEAKKYTVDELKELIAVYRAKAKELSYDHHS